MLSNNTSLIRDICFDIFKQSDYRRQIIFYEASSLIFAILDDKLIHEGAVD